MSFEEVVPTPQQIARCCKIVRELPTNEKDKDLAISALGTLTDTAALQRLAVILLDPEATASQKMATIACVEGVLEEAANKRRKTAAQLCGVSEARAGEMVTTMVDALLPLSSPMDEAACMKFLTDHTKFRIPVPYSSVPALRQHLDPPRQEMIVPEDWNDVTAKFKDLINEPPTTSGERTASNMVVHLLAPVFRMLQTHTATSGPFYIVQNSMEKATGSRSAEVRARLEQPDTLVVHSLSTFMIGVEKEPCAMFNALKDLQHYVQQGLGATQYGDIPGILGFAASGYELQFCFITRAGQVKVVGPVVDLSEPRGRLDAVCYAVQCHRLMALLASKLPPSLARVPLWTTMQRQAAEVMLTPAGATKIIPSFSTFAASMGTSQQILKQAYGAAAAAAAAQSSLGQKPFMIKARAGPSFDADVFTVHTAPLGYTRSIETEKDARHVASACLRTASVLHKVGIVNPDFRFENMQWLDEEHCMVIDLEACQSATAKLPGGFQPLKDWTEDTLHKGRRGSFYTTASDLYQIGVLMQKLVKEEFSEAARSFVNMLVSKQAKNAGAALKHEWFAAVL